MSRCVPLYLFIHICVVFPELCDVSDAQTLARMPCMLKLLMMSWMPKLLHDVLEAPLSLTNPSSSDGWRPAHLLGGH